VFLTRYFSNFSEANPLLDGTLSMLRRGWPSVQSWLETSKASFGILWNSCRYDMAGLQFVACFPAVSFWLVVVCEEEEEDLIVVTVVKTNREGARRYGFTGI